MITVNKNDIISKQDLIDYLNTAVPSELASLFDWHNAIISTSFK